MVNEWSDGSTSIATGDNRFFDPAAMDKNIQYVPDGKGGKTPTVVYSDLLNGINRLTPLPGETASEYNLRLSSGLSLGNTIAGQTNAAKVNLKYQPAIDDAKNKNDVENTIKTLAESGFTEELSPGQVKYYENNTPKGSTLNVQQATINGVTKYLPKPNNIYTRPKKIR
jgi:hypothetical protein